MTEKSSLKKGSLRQRLKAGSLRKSANKPLLEKKVFWLGKWVLNQQINDEILAGIRQQYINNGGIKTKLRLYLSGVSSGDKGSLFSGTPEHFFPIEEIFDIVRDERQTNCFICIIRRRGVWELSVYRCGTEYDTRQFVDAFATLKSKSGEGFTIDFKDNQDPEGTPWMLRKKGTDSRLIADVEVNGDGSTAVNGHSDHTHHSTHTTTTSTTHTSNNMAESNVVVYQPDHGRTIEAREPIYSVVDMSKKGSKKKRETKSGRVVSRETRTSVNDIHTDGPQHHHVTNGGTTTVTTHRSTVLANGDGGAAVVKTTVEPRSEEYIHGMAVKMNSMESEITTLRNQLQRQQIQEGHQQTSRVQQVNGGSSRSVVTETTTRENSGPAGGPMVDSIVIYGDEDEQRRGVAISSTTTTTSTTAGTAKVMVNHQTTGKTYEELRRENLRYRNDSFASDIRHAGHYRGRNTGSVISYQSGHGSAYSGRSMGYRPNGGWLLIHSWMRGPPPRNMSVVKKIEQVYKPVRPETSPFLLSSRPPTIIDESDRKSSLSSDASDDAHKIDYYEVQEGVPVRYM